MKSTALLAVCVSVCLCWACDDGSQSSSSAVGDTRDGASDGQAEVGSGDEDVASDGAGLDTAQDTTDGESAGDTREDAVDGADSRQDSREDGGEDSAEDAVPDVRGATATETLGASGGVVSAGQASLRVPAGALSEDVEITITAVPPDLPDAFASFSAVYEFAPSGLTFALPAELTLGHSGDDDLASLFWPSSDGEALVPLDASLSDGALTAEVTHFSEGFVGSGCGDNCCRPANGQVDLLLVFDNSASMDDSRALLAAEMPEFLRALTTGDIDDDGTQDLPGVSSLHVAMVTSDVGIGADADGCTVLGDDGLFVQRGTGGGACSEDYEPVQAYSSAAGGDVAGLAANIGCLSALEGTAGCGHEQPLEAMLKALTPATSEIVFRGVEGDVAGHGTPGGANAGFLRPRSVLVVVLMTDANDCSAADVELFDRGSEVYTGGLGLRCFDYADHENAPLHPVSRYVDGLLALRKAPADLVVVPIVGVPAELTTSVEQDLGAILADARMSETLNESETALLSACVGPGGEAEPGRRLLEVAKGVADAGGTAFAQSLCENGFAVVAGRILDALSTRVAGACGPGEEG